VYAQLVLPGKNGCPLRTALQHGNTAVVGAILEAGADINATLTSCSNGYEVEESPFQATYQRRCTAANFKTMVEFLVSRGATTPPRYLWPSKEDMYNLVREVAFANGVHLTAPA
jgi:hypothetical protein